MKHKLKKAKSKFRETPFDYRLYRNGYNAFILSPLLKKMYYKDYQNVLTSDWDQLLVLDACRFDLYKKYSNHSEEVGKRYSGASATPEWAREHFGGKFDRGIRYVSANPKFDYTLDEELNHQPFHDREKLWDSTETWDNKMNTVPPQNVAKRVKQLSKDSDARIVGHFLQPHCPFVIGDDEIAGFTGDQKHHISAGTDISDIRHPWKSIIEEKLSKEVVWGAYEKSVEYIVEFAENLGAELPGKTIITSDHGNSIRGWSTLFMRDVIGHPMNVHTPELVEVPWLEIGRRNTELDSKDREIVKSRLEKIGYVS